ncbi:FliM/FliN family flagellar motor switch protein [Govanella unica]|uniref:Flagellar motor switch protein FliN n=1 Tax=Govanella unica TaxID=2975056 RepID=A0A9X3TWP9_9PROT|nr:FliM/FliN family flagellar motor switch protein [Govania unica]
MSAVNDVKVEISVVLGSAVMPIRQLLKMGRGAVVDLDATHETQVKIYANNKLIALGDVVISGDRVAVTVTESVRDYQS